MGLERAAAWLNRHYTWPVVAGLFLTAVLAPVSYPVIGIIMLTAAAILVADLLRRTGRSFRDGYRGADQTDT